MGKITQMTIEVKNVISDLINIFKNYYCDIVENRINNENPVTIGSEAGNFVAYIEIIINIMMFFFIILH